MIVSSEGQIGDILFVCGILSEIGGKHSIILQKSAVTGFKTMEDVYKAHSVLHPLLSIQPYIEEFRPEQPGDHFDWISGKFRGAGLHFKENSLMQAHINHLIQTHGVGRQITGKNKWLTVEPYSDMGELVVMNRTFRYQNPYFPWNEIVSHYRDRLVFVGLPYEHEEFQKSYGYVQYLPTENLLELAKVIAGCGLFIGNQSSANAVCEGLKHNVIQEVSLSIPDCIWKRPNAQHVYDGKCVLPDIGGSGTLALESKVKETFARKTHMTPPGDWQFRGIKHSNLSVVVDAAIRNYPEEFKTRESAEDAILYENYRRLPDYFMDKSLRYVFDTFHRTYNNAH